MAYRCSNPTCAEPERVYASQEAQRLTVRGSSFALEVITQIGYWRFWHRWTVTQIHAALTQERCLLISERAVLYLIGVFLVLLRCTYPLRLAAHAASFRRQGLFVALDALKPEKGNSALYVARELKFGLVLHTAALLTADHRTVATRLLQPVKDLGYRLRGIVSDDEKALVLAVAQTLPGVPPQTCQIHCLREAAAPIANADRAFKKALKQAIRGPLYAVCRTLQAQLSTDDPCGEVLRTYAELIRSTLTEASKPPFALGGLRVFEDLQRLETSLTRSRQKGGTRSWSSYWPWLRSASPLPDAINTSNANGGGWWNWSGVSTPQTPRAGRARPASWSSAKSKSFWSSWNSTRGSGRKTPLWSPISARASVNAGRGCSSAMPGRSATARTMTWKPSLGGYGPDSGKSMAVNPSTSSSSVMVNGLSSSTPASPTHRSCTAFSSLTKHSLIRSMVAFKKPSNGSKCFIAFGIDLVAVSRSWNNGGLRLSPLNLNNGLVC
jgi:Transposase, Mutator family